MVPPSGAVRIGLGWAGTGNIPGATTASVRCFVAPHDGQVRITGRVYKLHLDGDGVRASIRHGTQEIWQTELDGRDARGIEPNLTLTLQRGDRLRFIIQRRGDIFCDTTGWDPRVTYADGTTLCASKAFGSTAGHEGWHYEMLKDSEPPATPPTLHGFRSDFTLLEKSFNQPLRYVARADEALPVFLIDDAASDSGFAVYLNTRASWRCRWERTSEKRLTLQVEANAAGGPVSLAPGERLQLPEVALAIVEGPWLANLSRLSRLCEPDAGELRFGAFSDTLSAAYRRATAELQRAPDPDLLVLAQAEWHREDQLDETSDSYAAAVAHQLTRAGELLQDLKAGRPAGFLAEQSRRLDRLKSESRSHPMSLREWRSCYLQTRLLKREIALCNPLLDFEQLVFCKRLPPSYSHLVAQYFGWRQRPGGGLYVLEDPGYSLCTRDIVGSQLPPGSFLEPRLSWDGERLVFSFVACPSTPLDSTALPVNEEGADQGYFHLYEVNVDGSSLRQLTRGPYDDLMPTYLPDDGIVFCSTRRRGYSRCFGPNFSRRWHSYTLHRMDADGGNLRMLSANDVSEWFPSVTPSGQILFARWDYIDRDAVTHQNLWAMRPDGSNPMAVWGNASPAPHCVFQAKPVPGSNKIAFIASAHHALTAGPICLLDPAIDSNGLEAITRLTPGPLPEAEAGPVSEYYEAPWPLSEQYFLVAYSAERLRFEGEHLRDPNPDNALGLYLLDAAGNRELLYRDADTSSTCPMPLASRLRPPILGPAATDGRPAWGGMVLTDIHQGLGDVPYGHIKKLRIVQVFPKDTWLANEPRVGFAGEENARAILGTVPVESDGSAYFVVPAHKPLLFQALDEDGFAWQTMRSTTYLQPGETTSCIGCHEQRASVPPPGRPVPLALRRAASIIDPGDLGGRPFSFVEVVQPILDRHCVRCHGGEKTEKALDLSSQPHQGFTRSYWALCGQPGDFDGSKTNSETAATAWVPRFGQRNAIQTTQPGGAYGALGSRLLKLLRDGHEQVKLSDKDLAQLAAWIDLNAVFYGAYTPEAQSKQLAGERIPMPAVQ